MVALKGEAIMSQGKRPDWIIKLPTEKFWHRLGVGFDNEKTISLVLDAGVPITINPGTKFVLVRPETNEG